MLKETQGYRRAAPWASRHCLFRCYRAAGDFASFSAPPPVCVACRLARFAKEAVASKMMLAQLFFLPGQGNEICTALVRER